MLETVGGAGLATPLKNMKIGRFRPFRRSAWAGS